VNVGRQLGGAFDHFVVILPDQLHLLAVFRNLDTSCLSSLIVSRISLASRW
jgi:hypothetical protein